MEIPPSLDEYCSRNTSTYQYNFSGNCLDGSSATKCQLGNQRPINDCPLSLAQPSALPPAVKPPPRPSLTPPASAPTRSPPRPPPAALPQHTFGVTFDNSTTYPKLIRSFRYSSSSYEVRRSGDISWAVTTSINWGNELNKSWPVKDQKSCGKEE